MEEDTTTGRSSDGDHSWRRREGETAKAYAAFCLYRDLGSGRSLEKARQALGKSSGYIRQLETWSSRSAWQERCRTYDAFLELLSRREREAAYIEDMEAMRQRQKQLSLATFNTAISLLHKAMARLKALDAADIDPGKLPAYFRAAAAVAEMATNAEAVALGLHELLGLLDARETAAED